MTKTIYVVVVFLINDIIIPTINSKMENHRKFILVPKYLYFQNENLIDFSLLDFFDLKVKEIYIYFFFYDFFEIFTFPYG